jgi:hypothetical protein
VTRTLGTTYYNTTGKPIAISIYSGSITTAGTNTLTVNGATASANYNSIASTIGYALVPPGASYVLTSTGNPGTLSWYELR